MLPLTTSIDEAYELGMISVRAYNVCQDNGVTTLLHLVASSLETLKNSRGCGRLTLKEFKDIIESYSELIPPPPKEEHIEYMPTGERLLQKYNFMSSHKRLILNKWITRRFSELNKEIIVTFPKLGRPSYALKTALSTDDLDSLSIPYCSRANEKQIKRYLKAIRDELEYTLPHQKPKPLFPAIDDKKAYLFDNVPHIRPDEEDLSAVIQKYSFLTEEEKDKVMEFAISHDGHIPYLYVAKRFIQWCKTQKADIVRAYYGFGPSGLRTSIQNLAEQYSFSSGRIRQIVGERLPLPYNLYDRVLTYLNGMINGITALDDPVWDRIQQDNMLDEPRRATVLLTCCLLGGRTIRHLSNDDTEYLFDREILKNIDFNWTFDRIYRAARYMQENSEPLDILQYIKPTYRINDRDARELCILYARALRKKRGVTVSHDRYVMPPVYTPECDDAAEMVIPMWD